VWAVLLAVVAATAKAHALHTILLVFGGWVIGWLQPSDSRGASWTIGIVRFVLAASRRYAA
jgi:hypothetical protein